MAQGSTEQPPTSLLQDALRNITHAVTCRPQFTLWIVVLVACAAAGWTLTSIGFKTNRSDLIDPQADFHKRWIEYVRSFGDASDLIVVVEADQPQQIPLVLEELGRRMEQEPQFFRSVLYRIDSGTLPAGKGLQYFTPAQLASGLENIRPLRPLWEGSPRSLALENIFGHWSRRLETVGTSNPPELQRLLSRVDLFTESLTRFGEKTPRSASPWGEFIPGASRLFQQQRRQPYFLNRSGTMGFLKAFPSREENSFEGASRSIDRLRQIIADVRRQHPGARIGITGIPVLENDEMRRSRSDMTRAAIISFVGVGLLLILGFRGLRHPLLALAMLAVGMAWSFGFTTLVVGHLNILSISFAVILIGLGIDFAIHYLARYLQLRHEGCELSAALTKTSASVGAGVVAAALTTAFAFFSATFTQFLGVAELGIIAGGGILLCAVATFVVLPALVVLADRGVEPKKLPTPFQGNLLRRLTARFPRPVMVLSMILIAGVGSQLLEYRDGQLKLRVRYDYNLLNLQADGLESVETQRRIFRNADHSLLYAVSIARSPEEARARKKRLEKLPSVDHVEELASALPAVPPQQTAPYLRAYRTLLASLPAKPASPPLQEPALIGRAIEQFYLRIRRLKHPLAQQVARRIDRFLDRFEQLSLKQQQSLLGGFQQLAAVSLHQQLTRIASATNTEPITLRDLPPALASRFISSDGKWLLQIYPKHQIWDHEPLSRFVADVRSVDPNVTGTPLQNLEASRQIKTSYKTAAIYALAVIVLVLLVDFLRRDYTLLTLLSPLAVIVFTVMALKTRRVEFDPLWLVVTYTLMAVAIAAIFDFRNLRDALLAILPALTGGLVMFGALGILGLNLNPANLIALPLILGLGVDDGVHIVHDFRSQRGPYRTSPSTMNAIVLTSLTSMIGFGSMMVAAHRGLYSVGLVLVIGVGSCLFVSLVTLPALLTILSGPQTATAPSPETKRRREAETQNTSGRNHSRAQHQAA